MNKNIDKEYNIQKENNKREFESLKKEKNNTERFEFFNNANQPHNKHIKDLEFNEKLDNIKKRKHNNLVAKKQLLAKIFPIATAGTIVVASTIIATTINVSIKKIDVGYNYIQCSFDFTNYNQEEIIIQLLESTELVYFTTINALEVDTLKVEDLMYETTYDLQLYTKNNHLVFEKQITTTSPITFYPDATNSEYIIYSVAPEIIEEYNEHTIDFVSDNCQYYFYTETLYNPETFTGRIHNAGMYKDNYKILVKAYGRLEEVYDPPLIVYEKELSFGKLEPLKYDLSFDTTTSELTGRLISGNLSNYYELNVSVNYNDSELGYTLVGYGEISDENREEFVIPLSFFDEIESGIKYFEISANYFSINETGEKEYLYNALIYKQELEVNF